MEQENSWHFLADLNLPYMKLIIMAVVASISLLIIHPPKSAEEMKKEKLKIEVWSDVVCPFCLVGKKNLEQAITNLNLQNDVEVIWHSYQLDPTFPKDTTILYYPYHFQRSGYTEKQLKPMSKRLNLIGKPYSIQYNFDKVLVINSIDLHRLLFWSKKFDLYNALNEALMIAYFTNGVDLSKQPNVLKIVGEVGLNTIEAKNILATDTYFKDVKTDIRKAQDLGINGVPYFLINGNEKISGAQDIKSFEMVISSALSKATLNEECNTKTMCLPEKGCGIE